LKICVLADVHANLPALDAVLQRARQAGAQWIWNAGDFVGYGAFPEEVVRRLRQVGAVSVLGNYDRKVLNVPQLEREGRRSKSPEKWLAFRWAYEHLSEESRAYLADLPEVRHIRMEGVHALMAHGSPENRNEHLMPETLDERFRELNRLAPADLVIVGHSHRAFLRTVDGITWLNPGSVGRPDDGDPRASFALLTLENGSITARLQRVAYDVEQAAAAIRTAGLPEAFAQMALRGRNFDDIQSNAGNGS
jgi:putative phosphoesterase